MITFSFLSLVTSVKDYVEITHKLIEIEPLKNYTEFGAVFTYFIFSIGDFFKNFFSFSLFTNIWSIPIIIPDIASAMISEVSVLDGYFHNAFTFLETNVNTATNPSLVIFEKFIIGLINSFFLFLPTSTSHLITLRRFVMQGLEAGYMAGLGTLAGNFFWLSSIILGLRFFVIPWLSLDIFRYLLGFILLVKYIWDSSKERRTALEDLSKWKIFLLNFFLALTEQSCIYPFVSNLSIGPDASILEGFPVDNYPQFLAIHGAYLVGILLGSFSLLQFTCWFWENPAFSIYLWITTKSSLKISTGSYYKILNFTFLYCTMLCAIASIPYYGLDYTLTNPIGLVPQDRILDQKRSQTDPEKLITETAFLGVNPTDKNSRIRDGVHARRERWKQRLIKYQAYDASVYDQGVYDFLTIEDLNYGFDRFWLRRKMRNHQIRFRLFPGPWMRSLKKQLNNPANPSNDNSNKAASGPRVEFFRILFEQFYHPNFHESRKGYYGQAHYDRNKIKSDKASFNPGLGTSTPVNKYQNRLLTTEPSLNALKFSSEKVNIKSGLIYQNSALRKFVRNFNTRLNLRILNNKRNISITNTYNTQLIYSKRWKSIFSKIQPFTKTSNRKSYQLFRNISKQLLLTQTKNLKLTTINQKLSTKERKILNLRTLYKTSNLLPEDRKLLPKVAGAIIPFGDGLRPLLPEDRRWAEPIPKVAGADHQRSVTDNSGSTSLKTSRDLVPTGFTQTASDKVFASALSAQSKNTPFGEAYKPSEKLMLLRPLNVYLQKEQAFKRKLRYYGTTSMRKLNVGNQAPYFKALMKRGFYYYKPSLRLKKTFYVASMRRGFRKKSRKQRILVMPTAEAIQVNSSLEKSMVNPISKPVLAVADLRSATHSYTVLGKRASRYRHQIYKDVLQHWYYTPFNRLLLKFDVDAFINRQPKSHFLTKNEERLLHIRRFLLSEYYDNLRWYTYMQHYRTMKAQIGGTKSFASRTYNQQFQGTFKKIRHLFAITPKQGDLYTLKFDQPLYNDNKLKDNVYFHDELGPYSPKGSHEELLTDNTRTYFSDRTYKSSSIIDGRAHDSSLRELIDDIKDTRDLNKTSYQENNSSSMVPKKEDNFTSLNLTTISDQSSYLIGKQYLNSQNFKNSELINLGSPTKIGAFLSLSANDDSLRSMENSKIIYTELFVKLIKECKKRVHDQNFLKNYITHRIEKREQLNQEQTKELNKRLEKLKVWLSNNEISSSPKTSALQTNVPGVYKSSNHQHNNVLTTGIQKAVKDSISTNKTNVFLQQSKYTYSELNNAYSINTEEQILTKLNLINLLSKEHNTKKGIVSTKLEQTKRLLQNTISTFKPILLRQTELLKSRTDKNLQWWRKKQRVITKRKNSRKRDRFKKQIATVNKKLAALGKKVETEKSNSYKTLYGNYEISDYLLTNNNRGLLTDTSLLRKKQDKLANSSGFVENSNLWQGFFTKKLRKKVSSKGRRYRSLSLARYLTATRKPRFVGIEGLTKIENITNINGSFLTKEEKQEGLDIILKNNVNLTEKNYAQTLKKSQIKKRSRHSWKKRSRHQFSRNHYKYRKRHIHGNGKLRVMNKKLKKYKAANELRQWWWNSFLPRYFNNLQIQTSKPESLGNQAVTINGRLSDPSFKPLSNLNKIGSEPHDSLWDGQAHRNLLDSLNSSNTVQARDSSNLEVNATNINLTTTSLPFYAGWDESLRKFVVTNRLLSRRDAGLTVTETIQNQKFEFTNAPIQGLNEGSFLYWQTDMPFNSYNIDQFITANQSFYAPIGWRRFEFRHSILQTWTNKSSNSNKNKTLIISTKDLRAKIGNEVFNETYSQLKNSLNYTPASTLSKDRRLLPSVAGADQKQETINSKKIRARRVKKRYKLLKQMPNQLMYSPTGPLLTDVLPSHYISVFDQQYRFPRNRYLKRNLVKTLKKTTLLALIDSNNQNVGTNKEFTLRKRVKPRRKYHRKRFIKKEGLIFPRRTKFTTMSLTSDLLLPSAARPSEEDLRWRPSSRSKQKRKEILRSKTKSNKRVKTNPLRLRQLRRREFQQLVKPIQRFAPRNGGFAWPGDYLRLEVVEMPKLQTVNLKKTSLKQKINVQPVGIMPRKYLIEKHNIKVLKKKLEKAYSSHQLNKAVKEYKLLMMG